MNRRHLLVAAAAVALAPRLSLAADPWSDWSFEFRTAPNPSSDLWTYFGWYGIDRSGPLPKLVGYHDAETLDDGTVLRSPIYKGGRAAEYGMAFRWPTDEPEIAWALVEADLARFQAWYLEAQQPDLHALSVTVYTRAPWTDPWAGWRFDLRRDMVDKENPGWGWFGWYGMDDQQPDPPMVDFPVVYVTGEPYLKQDGEPLVLRVHGPPVEYGNALFWRLDDAETAWRHVADDHRRFQAWYPTVRRPEEYDLHALPSNFAWTDCPWAQP